MHPMRVSVFFGDAVMRAVLAFLICAGGPVLAGPSPSPGSLDGDARRAATLVFTSNVLGTTAPCG